MSILIKGMEIPNGCASCKISRRNSKKMICPFIWKCEWDIHDPMSADHRLDGCHLVPVPDHGRLGDLDALYKEAFRRSEKKEGYYNCLDAVISAYDIENAPTVIPASKEGET